MRYGLALPNGGPELHVLVDLAAIAEASGWDGVFFEDYIVYQGQWHIPTYDPWVRPPGDLWPPIEGVRGACFRGVYRCWS